MAHETLAIGYPEALRCASAIGVQPSIVFAPVGRTLGSAPVPRELPASGPFIVINGSGNYHHETVPIVRSLLGARPGLAPLAYVQIDAHPDHQVGYRFSMSCGSFVGALLDDPRVASVHLLGQYPPALADEKYPRPCIDKLGYYRCDYFAKYHQYLVGESDLAEAYFPATPEALASARRNPAVRRVRQKKMVPPSGGAPVPGLLVDWRTLSSFDAEALPDRPVYLSIDLDVLRGEVVTDWRRKAAVPDGVFTDNQGDMELETLLSLIAHIGASRTVVAADFCGLLEQHTWLPPDRADASSKAIGQVYRALSAAVR